MTLQPTVTLYHGDCLEIMRGIPDGSVDAVVTDPPYVGLKGGFDRSGILGPKQLGANINRRIAVGDEWNGSLEWVQETQRVARYGAVVFCSYHSIPEVATAYGAWRRVALLTWYKRNSPPTGANVPRFTCEYVWCFAKVPGLRWDAITTTMLDIPALAAGCMASSEREVFGETKRAAHPTQKPIALMVELLKVTRPGDTVLDPFMGSGTTGVACVQTGRNFIGIEIDPGYYAIAERRIAQAQQQLRLLEVE